MKRWSNQNLANVGTEPMDISKNHGQGFVALPPNSGVSQKTENKAR